MTSVFQREAEEDNRGEEGNATRKAEMSVTQTQAKKCLEPPEAGRKRK